MTRRRKPPEVGPPPFQVGDVVTLKSGGTLMTVTERRCLSMIALLYCQPDGFVEEGELHADCLRLATTAERERAVNPFIGEIPF